jgi:hypothetical protein
MEDYPPSPPELYVTICSWMLYDETDASRSPDDSEIPSTGNQQPRIPRKPNSSSNIFALRPLSNFLNQLPSDNSTRLQDEREETERSDPFIINPLNDTPILQTVPESNQSTTNHPLANVSSITNVSTLGTLRTHAQHMQTWPHDQLEKFQKKQSRCYHYGTSLQRPLEEKVTTAAIHTLPIIPTDNNLQRV